MSKTYQVIIKALGVVALSMFLVAATLYLKGNRTNARIALGISMSVSGIALMMYSLRQ